MKIFLTLFFLLSFNLGCQSGSKKSSDLKNPIPLSEADTNILPWKQLTHIGINTQPKLYRKSQLLFLSSHRPEHIHPQVYLLNMKKNKIKRITYQHTPIQEYVISQNDFNLFFTSSMDEDEENQQFMAMAVNENSNKLFARFPASTTFRAEKNNNTEIYSMNLRNSIITRHTSSPGYDGNLSFKNNNLLFVSHRDESDDIYLMNVKNKNIKRLTNNSLKQSCPNIANDQAYWLQENPITQVYSLVSKNMNDNNMDSKVVFSSHRKINDLNFDAKKNWFFFSMQNADLTSHIYAYDNNNKCLTQLTHSTASEKSPVYNSAKKELYFSSNLKGNDQIFSLALPKLTCSGHKKITVSEN